MTVDQLNEVVTQVENAMCNEYYITAAVYNGVIFNAVHIGTRMDKEYAMELRLFKKTLNDDELWQLIDSIIAKLSR